MGKAAIEMKRISKSFGSTFANKEIDLTVSYGEIHALLGENGAGKSTLMNMLSGIYRPDSGFICMGDEEVHFASPKDSIGRGIGMIHQHFKLVDVMTARDNIVLGRHPKGSGGVGFFLNKKELNRKIVELSERYGLDVDPDKKVYEMSVGEKQTLEIMKVLYRGAKILIMDEPTAVLTPQDIERLFRIIRNMKEQGCAVFFITHTLNDVLFISDRITVLRRGEAIATVNTAEVEIPALIEMMVGRRVDLSIKRETFTNREELLRLDGLTVKNRERKDVLSDVSFALHANEIIGIAGVAASGQRELCEAIAGLQTSMTGRIIFEGEDILGKSPSEIIRRGIRLGFVPEDRLGMGLVSSMDIVHNIILKDYREQKGFLLRRGE
ncbi:MAG: ATP-binding cassette domain-containing protein, partial [Clostridiales Family XIII bacterium]|nr:ATP-binding cassette domain-containing protein [Clostridiales Family XIII bacterium]